MTVNYHRQKLSAIALALFMATTFFTLVGTSLLVHAQAVHGNHALIGSHGMVLIYDQEEGIFASHLPLYRSPHNYQIIYKVEVSEHEMIRELLAAGMVTVLPTNFDLNKLISGEAFSVEAQFFQGHFERGGQVKNTGMISFIRPVLVKKVTKEHSQAASFYTAALSKTKVIVAHKIQHPPSFDALAFMPLPGKAAAETNNVIVCDNPKTFDVSTISKQLELCGIPAPVYIEIRDFE
ncbi:hypothetical protein [Thalassomonas actiniarum]|uniref:Uncharacterized protein n=1 Tax=Thalassomonas actiniarum TaxID=485447 RepID=A0AAE9YXM5_9GAMM|nr:hypothetical protein [Thalassomonas actiniarum]WDE02259.1 hypothetical protein SG35_031385 [Thalassomonas actiniarum]